MDQIVESALEIDHTYAFIKTGSGNRYLKYAKAWGGFYIGFGGFPLDLVKGNYDEGIVAYPNLTNYRSSFAPLKEIYELTQLPWRTKLRLAVWNRVDCCLEIWEIIDQLRPFPREKLFSLFDDCKDEASLENSPEFKADYEHKDIANRIAVSGPKDFPKVLDHFAGPEGYRFLPARLVGERIPSESIYAPIDTLSVLRSLNQRTFKLMTDINPPGVPWPDGLFEGHTIFAGPRGPVKESGYGRFVREYLDSVLEPTHDTILRSLTADQQMSLICATLNPILVETAAMLFALDLGMVIDSGTGKGRQGIDIVAACGSKTTANEVIERLVRLRIPLHAEAADWLRQKGTLSFQCKGFHDELGLSAKRLVEFRPMPPARDHESNQFRGIPIQHVLKLAADPNKSGFNNLFDWLTRMCHVLVR